MRILPMSAVLCGCSVSPIDIRYQLSGVRYCSDPQYLDYCLFSGLSVIMRIQYAFCSLCNLGVYCKLLSSAMTYCCYCCATAGLGAGAAQQQLQRPTVAAAMPATTPAAAAIAFMCGRDPLFRTSVVGSRYSSP